MEDAAGAFRSTPDVVETPKLVDYLDGRGFLKTRLRASLAGRSPALQDEYDEAWFYARVRSATAHRETLPAQLEREAAGLAARSWPVSLILARYYARRDASRADGMAKQFAELAEPEFDMNRLARYRADVEDMAATVATACGPETIALLAGVLSDRFFVDPKIMAGLKLVTPRLQTSA